MVVEARTSRCVFQTFGLAMGANTRSGLVAAGAWRTRRFQLFRMFSCFYFASDGLFFSPRRNRRDLVASQVRGGSAISVERLGPEKEAALAPDHRGSILQALAVAEPDLPNSAVRSEFKAWEVARGPGVHQTGLSGKRGFEKTRMVTANRIYSRHCQS